MPIGDMSRQCVHQVRGQAVIGLQADRAQALTDGLHVRWRCAGFDDGGHERREARRSPSTLGRELGVDEVQTIKCMVFVLDAPEEMGVALLAGVPLNGGGFVDNCQFFTVGSDADLIPRYYGNDGECRVLRFPAFAAAARVVMQGLCVDLDLDLVGRTQALQGASCEIRSGRLETIVQCRVKFQGVHVGFSVSGCQTKVPGAVHLIASWTIFGNWVRPSTPLDLSTRRSPGPSDHGEREWLSPLVSQRKS